jgi:uncharacterized membrane protein required for colicin V production
MELIRQVQFSWFDYLVMFLLVIGFFQGRRRGMSEELLPLLQVLAILVVGSYYYQAVGMLYAQAAATTILTGYIAGYLTFVLLIKATFSFILKRAVGERIISNDLFGRMEYYFGMMAGALRWFCVVVIGLALLNAREIPEEKQNQKPERMFTEELLGQLIFPDFSSLQQEILERSFTGQLVKQHFQELLIQPVRPDLKPGDPAPKPPPAPAQAKPSTPRPK